VLVLQHKKKEWEEPFCTTAGCVHTAVGKWAVKREEGEVEWSTRLDRRFWNFGGQVEAGPPPPPRSREEGPVDF
jgi:hypothetical protein